MKNLNVKLTLLPNAVAFFGLLCTVDLQNLLSVAYCVAIFVCLTFAHLFDLYRLKNKVKVFLLTVNTIFCIIALTSCNWLLLTLSLIIIDYILLLMIFINKPNN